MSLTPGSRLGTYEVIAKLGEGGMGEVYTARDSRLNRDVALKVLLPAVTNDPDRLARFSREAQVLASLNHPNIAAIYAIEESAGVTALVMELVEGENLSQRIARAGPVMVARRAIWLNKREVLSDEEAFSKRARAGEGEIHNTVPQASLSRARRFALAQ